MPDLPLEETEVIRNAAQRAGLELVMLTTPTTPIERAKRIAAASQGFVYLVSVAGGPALLWSDPICVGEAAGMVLGGGCHSRGSAGSRGDPVFDGIRAGLLVSCSVELMAGGGSAMKQTTRTRPLL